jgi:hypothetical protein
MSTDAERIVHARLDPESRRILDRLRRRTGLNDSEIVRRALRALAGMELAPKRRPRAIGLGKFESGVPDLGSNAAHFEGFGRS